MFAPINRFSVLSNSVNNIEKENFFNVNKVVNENTNGVNPKIISGSLVLKDLSIGFSDKKEVLFQRA